MRTWHVKSPEFKPQPKRKEEGEEKKEGMRERGRQEG